MIKCCDFYNELTKIKISFFCGVPDSLLKDFCAFITDTVEPKKHIITANEGNAIALASGHFLATGNSALVYMQNSGQGNAINPLVSLADPDVYGIPILLLIGWRGEPGKKDEPQHIKQGKITLSLMKVLDIPFKILPTSIHDLQSVLSDAERYLKQEKRPYALIIKKGSFDHYDLIQKIPDISDIEREKAIKMTCELIGNEVVIVSTTGKISRELYEYRDEKGMDHGKDFLTIGAMGHVSQIALGIALAKPEKQVFCFDGDGSVIMHMGCLGINGSLKLINFKHIIFNNGVHDSVGGQPTVGLNINFIEIAKACGYQSVYIVKKEEELEKMINMFKISKGPALLEIHVKKGARSDLGRPRLKSTEIKNMFMKNLNA